MEFDTSLEKVCDNNKSLGFTCSIEFLHVYWAHYRYAMVDTDDAELVSSVLGRTEDFHGI